ncbi:MAG: hypothetical protein ABIZ05_12025 [Pseudonocardiaceae bacterium]
MESDVEVPFEPGSALPFEPDSDDPAFVGADGSTLLARLSLR